MSQSAVNQYYVAHKMVFALALHMNDPISKSTLNEDISKPDFINSIDAKGWITGSALCYQQSKSNRIFALLLGTASNKTGKVISSLQTELKKLELIKKSNYALTLFGGLEFEKYDGQKDFGMKGKSVKASIIEVWPLMRILFNYPLHMHYVPLRILSEKEVKELLEFNKVTVNSLPILASKDISVLWAGAKRGDIVEIERYQLNVGLTHAYKYIN